MSVIFYIWPQKSLAIVNNFTGERKVWKDLKPPNIKVYCNVLKCRIRMFKIPKYFII